MPRSSPVLTVASLFHSGSALRKPRLREAPARAYPRWPRGEGALGGLGALQRGIWKW